MAKIDILAKALKCIDEVSPYADTPNRPYFPVEDFIDEAVHFVVDVVPIHALGRGNTIQSIESIAISEDGVGTICLSDSLQGRIIYFKVGDWMRAVTSAIHETHPRYNQQSNRVLRGTPSRPIVALTKGSTAIEFYSTRLTEDEDWRDEETLDVRYMPYDADNIPPKLIDLTAWKLAEVVLLSISDSTAASVCTARVNELLEQLAI
jgi:hypothetical protein